MNTAKTIGAAVASAMLVAALLAGCSDNPEKLVASAKQSLAKGDRNAAIIELKNALQANPDLGEARLLLGKSLLETGDFAAAEKELRRARELKVPEDQVAPPLARALVGQGEYKKVLDEFGKVELTAPEARAELLTTLAVTRLAGGDREAGRAGFAVALQAVPGYPPAVLGEAKLKAAAGDAPGAMAQVDTVLATSPKLFEAWTLKGDIADQQNTDAALAAYRKALELRPDALSVHTKIVLALLRQGNTKDAAVQADAMKKLAPKHPQTQYVEALVAFRQKNMVAARESIQHVLRAAPENLAALVLAGSIEYHLGAYAQAEANLRKALQVTPKDRSARIMLVNTYVRNRNPVKAMETVKPLLDDPNPGADVLALAGEIYMYNGNTREAERLFARAAAEDPKDPNKRTGLALAHISTGDAERGLKELAEVSASDPGIRADLALIATMVKQQKYDEALKAIAVLEKKQPDKPLAHNLRGGIYLTKGDADAARKSFERALAVDPTDYAATLSLARLDLAARKPDDARKRFEALLAKNPKNAQALLAIAELRAQGGGTTDEVAKLIGDAIAADPTSVVPRRVLITQYLARKEPRKAVAAAQDALAAIPNNPELLDAAGQAELAAGDTNQALATFGKLAQLQPNSPEPYIRMAGAQMAAKDPDGAVQSLKKALALNPDLASAQRAMVKASMDSGNEATALEMARSVQKQRPKESEGYILEGDIHAFKKAWPEAAGAFRNGIKNAGTTDLAIRLDSTLRAANKTADSEKFTAEWLSSHPKDREFRFYLAEQAMVLGDYQGAVRMYKSILEIKPDDAMALNNLAYFSGKLKDPKAIEYAEKANKIAPDNPAILDTLGMLLVEKGDVKRGVDTIKRAVALSPVSPVLRLNLARALLKDGQKADAKKELETLAQLGDRFSSQAEVKQLLQGL